MKLAEKGHFAPPPPLPKHAQTVSEHLATWPKVHARTHWLLGDETEIDGADFYLGEEELGHLHLDGEAHVAVPKKIRDALIAAGSRSALSVERKVRRLCGEARRRCIEGGVSLSAFVRCALGCCGARASRPRENRERRLAHETGRSRPDDAAARTRAGRCNTDSTASATSRKRISARGPTVPSGASQ